MRTPEKRSTLMRTVSRHTKSIGRVSLPISWLGKKVTVSLIEKPDVFDSNVTEVPTKRVSSMPKRLPKLVQKQETNPVPMPEEPAKRTCPIYAGRRCDKSKFFVECWGDLNKCELKPCANEVDSVCSIDDEPCTPLRRAECDKYIRGD